MNKMIALPIAAATALPVPASAEPTCSFPELAARFLEVHGRGARKRAQDKAHSDLVDRLFFDATGLEWRDIDHRKSKRAFKKYQQIMEKILAENPGSDVDETGSDIEWDKINADLQPVVEAMLKQPAASVADLAWQAEAITTWNTSFLQEGDPDTACLLRRLFENIGTLAGPLPLLSGPSRIGNTTPPDDQLLTMIYQLWALRPRYDKVFKQFEEEEARWFERRPCADASDDAAMAAARVPYDEIWQEIRGLEHEVFSTEAHTVAGIKAKANWHLQFYCGGDVEMLDASHCDVESLFQELGGNADGRPVITKAVASRGAMRPSRGA